MKFNWQKTKWTWTIEKWQIIHPPPDHIIQCGDHIIEYSDHIIQCGDQIIEYSDHIIQCGDHIMINHTQAVAKWQ